MALFWLRTSYHAQRYMFQCYMLRSLLTQSFNIVNRVEMSTDFATRVPDIHYPTGTRVLVTVNLVSD